MRADEYRSGKGNLNWRHPGPADVIVIAIFVAPPLILVLTVAFLFLKAVITGEPSVG